SRGHGAVLSGVLPSAAPKGTEYRLWVLSDSAAIDAGNFTADEHGRVSWLVDRLRETNATGTGAAVTPVVAGERPRQSSGSITSRALLVSSGVKQIADGAVDGQFESAGRSHE